MWCRQCNGEYEGQSHCPDCGAPLEDLPQTEWKLRSMMGGGLRWPYKYDGEPEMPKFLAHKSALNMDDKLFEGLLENYEIPFFTRFPNNGEMGKLYMGLPGGGVDFYVPESFYEKAQEIISQEL